MKPSDFQKTVQCRFESCLKKVVRHVVKDYQQGLKRRKDKEIPFCELPEIFRLKLAPQPQLWCILVYSVVSLSVSSTFRKFIISS